MTLSRRQRRLFFFVPFQATRGGPPLATGIDDLDEPGGFTDRGVIGDAWNRGVRRIMSDKSANQAGPVSFGERLAGSQAFLLLFREGMALVEETAGYLDGPGRRESKALDRGAAVAYATESMRLTTRLMQLASWLLLHRAVNEGEMTLTQANREKTKVKLSAADPGPSDVIEKLPQTLQDLIARSMSLQARVRRLDASIHAPTAGERTTIGNPLVPQLNRLKAAFEP